MEIVSETRGSEVERYTMNKFNESVDKWNDRITWPIGMVDTLERVGVHDFVFGQFNFNNEKIYDVISNFDDGDMKLVIFGRKFSLEPILISKSTIIPCRGRVMLTSWKFPKLEKNEMTKKICGENIYVPKNGLRVKDVS